MLSRILRVISLAFALSHLGPALARADMSSFGDRPDAHAPIGVMGDHVHAKGEWMLSYRYAHMRMDGNRKNTNGRSSTQVLQDYPVTPTDMDVDVHMFGLMFAPTSYLALSGMFPVVYKEMDHRTGMGARFETKSEAFGDIKLGAQLRLWMSEAMNHHLHLNAGVSVPTGDTGEKDGTPMGQVRLPYPMQIGSGTWDVIPGLTYTGHSDSLSWGAQALGVIRAERNDKGYRPGHRAEITSWIGIPLTPWLSLSGRTSWLYWGNYHGRDKALNPALVPTADPKRRRGHRLDLLAGVNIVLPFSGKANRYSWRLAAEAGLPAYQWLDGPQLETDWRLTLGLQKAFRPFSLGPLF